MPEGIYYTQALYVARFGEAEAIRLTDDVGIGIIDATAMTSAIVDVSADMDGYLGRRYDLPIATPLPRMLVSIAAALVREKLHTSFPTDMVTREADEARRKLRDLSTGTAVLPNAEGEDAVTTSGASAILYSAPARVFSAEVLKHFG